MIHLSDSDSVQTLWQIYSSYTESEIDAMTDKNIELLDKLSNRKALIRKALASEPENVLSVIWQRVAGIGLEIENLATTTANPALLRSSIDDLLHYAEILEKLEGQPVSDGVKDFVQQRVSEATLDSHSDEEAAPEPTVVSPPVPQKPAQPTVQTGPRRLTRNVKGKTFLDPKDREALKALAYGIFDSFDNVAKAVFTEVDFPRPNLIWARKRCVAFLELVWENPETIQDKDDSTLVKQLIASFVTLEAITHRLNRFNALKPKPAKVSLNGSSPTPALEPEKITALGSRSALAGFMSPEHSKLIREALLHPDGPTLSLPKLVTRTGFTQGSIDPVIRGAFKHLQSVLDAYDSRRDLHPDAIEIIGRIREKWPTQSSEEIQQAIGAR